MAMTNQLQILNPVASRDDREYASAPRVASLEGKALGLAWNGKPGGNIALERLAQRIQETHKNVRVLKLYDDHPFGQHVIDKIIATCDVVVGSTAD
jgi:hypothetical protein